MLPAPSRWSRHLLWLVLGLPAGACRPSEPAPAVRTVTQVSGTSAERIARVQSMLRLPDTLRATIRDADALEEKIGDGRFGPSDFLDFVTIRVSPRDMPLWHAHLSEPLDLNDRPMFAEPSIPVSWWVPAAEFPSLPLFGPGTLTARSTGWVAVNDAAGTIYIHTFTR